MICFTGLVVLHNQYGALKCIVHLLTDVMVLVISAHPLQLVPVVILKISLCNAVRSNHNNNYKLNFIYSI